MKLINNTSLLFLLLFLSMSCMTKEGSYDPSLVISPTYKDSLELVFTTADTLNLKNYISGNYIDYQTVQEDSAHYLIGINIGNHALEKLNLSTLSSAGQIVFESEGPHGIKGSIDGFYYHNRDTIFVLSIDENTIHLMNDEGKKVDAFNFNRMPLPDGFEDYDVYANQGLMNGPEYNATEKTLQFYTYRWADSYKTELFASYSIETRSFQAIYGQFPDHYNESSNFIFYEDPGLLTVDHISYVYFGTSPRIYAYDNRSGELLWIKDYHSQHWPGTPESLPLNADGQEEIDWLTEVAAYIFILYDEQNQLFYRMMKRKQPVTNADGLLNSLWFGKWSIDIFDKDFNPIGHTEISAKTVLPIISFVSGGKLWIKNPSAEAKENESLYYTLQIQEK